MDPQKAREYRRLHREERNKASRELYAKSPERRQYLKEYLQKWRKRGILPKSPKVPAQMIIPSIKHKEVITNTPSPKPVETPGLEGLPGFITWNPQNQEPFIQEPSKPEEIPVKGPTWIKCENVTHEENMVCGLDSEKRRCREIAWYICRELQGANPNDFGE